LVSLFKDFRRSQVKTLALVVLAIMEVGFVRSMALAQHLAASLDVLPESALNRLYRLLRNPRFTNFQLTTALLRALADKAGELLIGFDWTEWVDGKRVLLGAVIAGTRGIPVAAASHLRHTFARSQNAFENTLFQFLRQALHEVGAPATVLADRGFRRVSLIRLLKDLELPFVIRLISDVSVLHGGRWVRLRNFHLRRGEALDLGLVCLGRDRTKRVEVRVVGVRAPGQKESWWLATSRDCTVAHVVALYDRRMAVEEQIRDTKGSRFGLDLEWTQFENCDHIDRLVLLTGCAVLVLTAVGHMVAETEPKVRMPHPTKGPRQSYLTIGLAWLYVVRKRVRLGARVVLAHVPRPAFRHFAWIRTALGQPVEVAMPN
jgi:hypothetical protein